MPEFLQPAADAVTSPIGILTVGVVTVIGLIIFLRVHAFLALIISALLVSLLAPAPTAEGVDKISRVATEFGNAAGKIGIVIALAAVIGDCMMRSGAADRIVRAFLSLLGEKRASVAMMGSGYVLAVPVFFDTVFYLLVPLARSLYKRIGKNYLLYLVAIGAGGAVTHTLVPPTPGPLLMAANLGVDVGMMLMMGLLVALPAAFAGLGWGVLINKWMPIPLREGSATPEDQAQQPPSDDNLPSLGVSLLPVLIPVLLITTNTVIETLTKGLPATGFWRADVLPYTKMVGNPNIALLASAVVSLLIFWNQRRPSLTGISRLVEHALMSGGVIILITAAGGAFGAMLREAQIGPAIKEYFGGKEAEGTALLFLAFGISSLLKIAQGSSTVAMITASGMLAAILSPAGTLDYTGLPYHPVYLALAIGAGSKVISWMNDSGFWVFAKMGGLTEPEALKSWTVSLALMGVMAMAVTLLLSRVLPMPLAP